MTTETLIENMGSESKVQTRSRTARKYDPEAEEKAITTESTFTGHEGIENNSKFFKILKYFSNQNALHNE